MAIYQNERLATHELQQQLIQEIQSLQNQDVSINTVNHSNIAVGDTASIILNVNNSRLHLVITNTGNEICYLDFNSDPTSTAYSFVLYPGSTYVAPFNFVGAIHALSNSIGTTLNISEFTHT